MNEVKRKYIEENLFGNNIPVGTAEENYVGFIETWGEIITQCNQEITLEDIQDYLNELSD